MIWPSQSLQKLFKVMENFQLTKKSSNTEIKEYFNAVQKLTESADEFPVNLNEVWMLVYGRKSDATEALQRDFIEDVDYKVLRQNPQNSNGGRPSNEHKLTLSCMEYFIARKVRPVFEVYRQVFHKVTKHELSRKELAMLIIQAEDEKERLAEQNRLQERQLKEAAPKIEYFNKALSSVGTYTATQIAKEFGWGAETLNRKLKELGIHYKQNGQWIFYAKYDGKGYTKSVTRTFTRSDGTTGSQMQTVFTEKGRKFIHELLNSNLKNEHNEKRRCLETGC